MQVPRIFSVISLCFILSIPVFAQKQDTVAERQKVVERQKENLIKINLSALVFKNISVQFERKVSKSIKNISTNLQLNIEKINFHYSFQKLYKILMIK